MEYPLNSGVEHLFEAGLWLGAYRGGQLSVSTGSLDDASGYAAGKAGFEFSPLPGWPVLEKSSLPGNPNYSLSALAHQEFELHFTDSLTYVPGSGQPIANHLLPLNARVQLNSLAWNFPFADYFTVLRYRITNLGPLPWDSLFIGMWSDLVVRNVNVTNDRGGAFFNKGSVGAEDSMQAIYAFHVTGDDAGFANSYGAIQYLGAELGGTFYHPVSPSSPGFRVNPNYWIYNQAAPTSDLQRYDRLRNRGNFGPSANLNVPGNRVQPLCAPLADPIRFQIPTHPEPTFATTWAGPSAPSWAKTPMPTVFWITERTLTATAPWIALYYQSHLPSQKCELSLAKKAWTSIGTTGRRPPSIPSPKPKTLKDIVCT
jgi:hypothetical protein